MLKKTAIFLLTSASYGAHAEDYPFKGFYGQLSAGFQQITPRYSGTAIDDSGKIIPIAPASPVSDGLTSILGVGYTLPVYKKLVLAIGGEYYPFSSASGVYTVTFTDTGETQVGNYYLKHVWNVLLSPGVTVSGNDLLYFKVGYTGRTMETSVNFNSSTNGFLTGSRPSRSNGYSLGAGYKFKFLGNFYALAEYNYADYPNSVTVTNTATISQTNYDKLSFYNFMLGVGYQI